ncbi:MAG: hypothetical protein ACRD4Q_10970 [Candidatus Acidiferrales bacterium]
MIGSLEAARFSVERAIRENDLARRLLKGASPDLTCAVEQAGKELTTAMDAIQDARREAIDSWKRSLLEIAR